MQTPLVSVMITCYNQQDFIESAVCSALEQDYANLQVVVTDDASTDRSPEILKVLQGRFPERLEVLLNKTKEGITRNHNRGLAACRGKYIFILNGDDQFLPGKVATMVERMEAAPQCAIAFHNVEVFDSVSDASLFTWERKYQVKGLDAYALVRYGNFTCSPSICLRAASIGGLRYDERIEAYSDWLFYVHILCENPRSTMLYEPKILARYRRHPENITLNWAFKIIEQYRALDYIQGSFAVFAGAVSQRKADLMVMKSVREFVNRRYRESAKSMLRALILARYNFIILMRLPVREMAYALSNPADPVLRSLLSKRDN
jgi:glycosyltransferase involved in cell wall biosynthesis